MAIVNKTEGWSLLVPSDSTDPSLLNLFERKDHHSSSLNIETHKLETHELHSLTSEVASATPIVQKKEQKNERDETFLVRFAPAKFPFSQEEVEEISVVLAQAKREFKDILEEAEYDIISARLTQLRKCLESEPAFRLDLPAHFSAAPQKHEAVCEKTFESTLLFVSRFFENESSLELNHLHRYSLYVKLVEMLIRIFPHWIESQPRFEQITEMYSKEAPFDMKSSENQISMDFSRDRKNTFIDLNLDNMPQDLSSIFTSGQQKVSNLDFAKNILKLRTHPNTIDSFITDNLTSQMTKLMDPGGYDHITQEQVVSYMSVGTQTLIASFWGEILNRRNKIKSTSEFDQTHPLSSAHHVKVFSPITRTGSTYYLPRIVDHGFLPGLIQIEFDGHFDSTFTKGKIKIIPFESKNIQKLREYFLPENTPTGLYRVNNIDSESKENQ